MAATLAQGLSPVREELANGAVVLVQETSMTPAVTISASFHAGSVFDPPEQPGLAYLTGRVLDRGTATPERGRACRRARRPRVSLRVSTNRQALTISCTCLSEDFEDVLAIIVDVARNPAFPAAEVEKRRSEALTVLRQNEDNPAARAVEGVLELLYTKDHPYGRPSKGTAVGVERVSRADLVEFHARRLRPGALSVAIVGDVAAEDALSCALAALDGWRTPPPEPVVLDAAAADRPVPAPDCDAREAAGRHRLRLHGRAAPGPALLRYWMMNNILGQFGLGGRLADNIRERQGMAYYAFSTFDPAPLDAPLLIRAGVDPANVERALEAIDHEVHTLVAAGPTATELDESRAYLIGSIPRMLETNQGIAGFLQMCEEYGLGLDFDQRLPHLLAAVTLEQVHAAAAEALDPDRAAIVIAHP